MAKSFDAQSKFNKFDTHSTQNTQSTHNKQQTQGRPRLEPEQKLRGYRYNLNLDRDLKPYLHEIAWQKRTSITQYINDLIRADMESYLANGGTMEGWAIDEE